MIQVSFLILCLKIWYVFYEEFGGEEQVMEEFEENGVFSDEILMKVFVWYMVIYGEDSEEDIVVIEV